MRSVACGLIIIALHILCISPVCCQPTDNFESSLQKLKNESGDNFQQILESIIKQQQGLDFETARANLEVLLQVSENSSNKKGISTVLRELGELHKKNQKYEDSYAYFEKALKVAETTNLPYKQAEAKGSLGMLMIEQSKFDEGIVYYLEAADLFEQNDFPAKAQEVYLILGNTYYKGRDFYNAVRYYKQALKASQNLTVLNKRMWIQNSLGLAYNHLGQLDSALAYFAQSLKVAEILQDSFYIGLINGNTGIVYIKTKEYTKAIECLKIDAQLSQKAEQWKSAGGAMASLAEVYQSMGENQRSGIYLDSALIFAKKESDLGLMIIINKAYVNQYKQQQDYQKAFEYLSQVLQLTDSLNTQMQTERAAELDAAYSFQKNMAEIEYLEKNGKLQRIVIGIFSLFILLLFIFSFLLTKLIRQRTKANKVLAQQKSVIEQKNKDLHLEKDKSLLQNKELESANEQISILNKKLEQKLKTSEANIMAMINNTTDLIFSIDKEYRLTEFNDSFVKSVEEHFGFTPQRGQSVFDTIHDVDIEGTKKNYDRTFSGERVSELYEIPVNNTINYAEAFFSPILLEQQLIGATIIVRDITDHKKGSINLKIALEKIQESEKFLGEIIDNLPVGMQILDNQGDMIRANEALKNIMCISEIKPGVTHILAEPFHKASGVQQLFDEAYQGKTLLNQEIMMDMDIPYQSGKFLGNKKWLSVSTIPVHDTNGVLQSVIGMYSDITERKEAEIALKESERRLRTVIHHNPIIIWATDKEGIVTLTEGQGVEKLETPPEESVGGSIFDLFPENTQQYQPLKDALEKGIPYDRIDKIGENLIYNTKAFPYRNEQGEIMGLLGTSIDITERIQYEEKLKQSESNLFAIINNSNYSIWSVDTELRLITYNEIFKNYLKSIYGGELGVGESVLKAIPASERTQFKKAYNKVLKGSHHNFEYNYQGGYFDVLMNPIVSEEKVTGVAVFAQDITERKKIQLKLVESEERLSLATETANVGIWELDLHTSKLVWNDVLKNIYGFKNEDVLSMESWDKYLHPEDIHCVKEEFAELLKSDKKRSVEFRICRSDGESRFIKGFAQVFQDDFGKPQKVIGVSMDITEQKENEMKLKQQHQEIIDTQKKIADYKLMALRSVMNPHFLFNSLNSIQFFIAKNEREQALNYLSLFSKLIRGILNSAVTSTIPLAEELKILEYYIELEALRFENKFETSFMIGEEVEVENLEIPSLLIQPYVENAIIHGLYNKEGRGKLNISIARKNNQLICIVEDNGVGRKEAMQIKNKNHIRHKSVGMMVTQERLDIINKTNKVSVKIEDLFDDSGHSGGTRVKLLIHI